MHARERIAWDIMAVAKKDGAGEEKVWTLEELASTSYVAFQGGVYDMSAFAPGHPGGAELVTEWFGKDGTDALLEAHPGGKAFIKHTLGPKDFAAAYKGSIPYEKKKRAPTSKKGSKKSTGGSAALNALPWRSAAYVAGAGIVAALLYKAHLSGMLADARGHANWIPKGWPTWDHIVHFVLGALTAAVASRAFRSIFPSMSGESEAGSPPGTAVGGWSYGTVTPALVDAIRAACPEDGQVHVAGEGEDADRQIKMHSGDMGFHKKSPPEVVVFPRSAAEVQEVVKAAHSARVPVVPRGAGSGLEGGAIPYQGGVVLDLMHMKDFKYFEAEMQAQVGPGLKKSELNDLLAPHGMLFGPDPASNPSLGGMASTRGSGLSTLMYGTTAENVVSLLVVTPDGRLVRTRRRVRKSATGYELTQLYVGSEGTLGVIVELTVKVRRIPKVRCGALVAFANIRDAATATIALVRGCPPTLCRCELLNADGVRATNKKFETNLEAVPTIFLEYRGDSLDACLADAAAGEKVARANQTTAYKFADKGEDLDKLWEARRGCYIAAISYREMAGDRVYLSDTCVPISNVATMLAETEADFISAGFPCIICAHIADGNFHACIPYQPDQQAAVKEIETRMIRRALSLEGTVSGEHGVGVGKISHILEEHGEDHINLQRAVKRAIDPKNIMNPGKIFILPRVPGGCCDAPAIYHQTETTDGGDKTYEHK